MGAPPGSWRGWARANLFGTWPNSFLTVVLGLGLGWATWRAGRFVLVTADWDIVRRNLTLFMVGRFPRDDLWRPWAALYAVAATLGLAVGLARQVVLDQERRAGLEAEPGSWRTGLRRFWPLLLFAAANVALVRTPAPALLVLGAVAVGIAGRLVGARLPPGLASRSWLVVAGGLGLAVALPIVGGGVGWDRWGGLQLTLFATMAGIGLAFPLGLFLALGRRSSFPAVRATCVTYIEVIRGVPLVALLLMGQFFIGFFLPTWMEPPSLVARALLAIVAFEAAYIAEIVRGGLQAVPRGQVEAAQSLGLPAWKSVRLIVLPQALRAVIPAMVGQFISLFKDTSLLVIIGLLEFLAVAQAVTSQPEFLGQGLASVTLPYAAFGYWAVSYSMSRESQRLERRLGVGER